ncbi:tetratricopeptide repeat protein [Paraburkholderia sediminicola]|uniref:tetratricopeptide repeat protein n=1 Tax=Paraburkholderia sediminicola TaxID=458836 RepID=UPI0038BA66E8
MQKSNKNKRRPIQRSQPTNQNVEESEVNPGRRSTAANSWGKGGRVYRSWRKIDEVGGPLANIPFSTFNGHLKSMRWSRFSDAAKEATKLAFPHFFQTAAADPEIKRFFRNRPSSGTQPPYSYRRFAGGAEFPRERYYSISDGNSGDDQETLLYELLAYTAPGTAGAMIPIDGLYRKNRETVGREFGINPARFSTRAINLLFIDDDERTLTPLFRSEGMRSHRKLTEIVCLPYTVERMTIEGVIDLRLPQTREWFEKNILAGLPDIRFVYGKARVERLSVGMERPERSARRPRRQAPVSDRVMLTWAPRSNWDGETIFGTDDFFGLLPFLTFPQLGGSPVTEAIGVWLRNIGANGLVYPSARNDVAVRVEKGVLIGSRGWCFVDYRNAPPPTNEFRLIFEPDSWSSIDGFLQPEVIIDKANHAFGSWRLLGRAHHSARQFRAGQLALLRAMLSHQRENQTGNPSRKLESLASSSVAYRLWAAREAYRAKDYALCKEGLYELVRYNAASADAYFLLGLTEAKLGDHQAAITAFENASILDPGKSEAHANIGNSFIVLGDFAQAAAAYSRALEIDPNDSVALRNIKTARILSRNLRSNRGSAKKLDGG